MSSRVGSVAKLIGRDLIGSLIWFPVWWYSAGLMRVIRAIGGSLQFRLREYGFAIWIKNFFVPMYGQYDITGRIVSVFMRLVVLIGRVIALVVEVLIDLAAIIAWIALPIVCVAMFVVNLSKAI